MCNYRGSDKQFFMIRKVKNSHCFHKIKQLLLPYFSNAKAQMTGSIWLKILLQLDQRLMHRNTMSFYSGQCTLSQSQWQYPSLYITYVFQNVCSIKIAFLLPNCTSLVQPLDLGIIQNAKVHYWQQIIRKHLEYCKPGKHCRVR